MLNTSSSDFASPCCSVVLSFNRIVFQDFDCKCSVNRIYCGKESREMALKSFNLAHRVCGIGIWHLSGVGSFKLHA